MEAEAYTVTRRLQKAGTSYVVCLPKLWIIREGLGPGSILELSFNHTVIISPVEKKGLTSGDN